MSTNSQTIKNHNGLRGEDNPSKIELTETEAPSAINSNLGKLIRAIGVLSLAVLLPSIILTFLGLVWFAGNFTSLLNANDDPDKWIMFATFMGFVAQMFIGGATIGAAWFVSSVVTKEFEEQRSKEALVRAKEATDEADRRANEATTEAHRRALESEKEADRRALERRAEQRGHELIRLSEKLVDTEFYIKVMYPAWEVALKWMDDSHPGIAAYRAEVVGAEFRLPKNYRARKDDKDLAENNPRRHPHYKPYDKPNYKNVIAELSESLAFATWVRFWRNVKFLIDRDLIDKADARHLFREWYMWWAPFMTEFSWVCVAIRRKLEEEYGYIPNMESWRQSSVVKIIHLQRYFRIPMHCGHRSKAALKERIAELSELIWKEMKGLIEDDPNLDIDGRFDEERKSVEKLRRKAEAIITRRKTAPKAPRLIRARS